MANAHLDFAPGSLPAEGAELASQLALSAAHTQGSVALVEEWLAERRSRNPFEVVLAHADMRPGYRDVIELGPTVQCAPANFHDVPPERRPAFLDLVHSPEVEVRFDALQSEEGGRFQHAVVQHLVVEVGDGFPHETSPDFCWLTVGQLMALVGSSYQPSFMLSVDGRGGREMLAHPIAAATIVRRVTGSEAAVGVR